MEPMSHDNLKKGLYLASPDLISHFMFSKEENLSPVYKILFETAAESLVVTDETGSIVLVNAMTNKMFGYIDHELIGQKLEVLLPKEYRKAHVKHREAYNHSPKQRSMGIGMDLWAKRKDDSKFPVEVSLNYFKTGDKTFVMGLVTDITERYKAEEQIRKMNEDLEKLVEERTQELEESKRLYQIVARNFPDGTINVFDKELKYVFAEGSELFKYGITSEKLVGTDYIVRLPAEVRQEISEKLKGVFQGTNVTFELQVRNNIYLINAVGLHNNDGKIEEILMVEQNITRKKKAEEDMQRALEKEKQLNELKSRFVSMASHEFRTPLSTILSSSSLVEKYLAKADDDPATIKENTNRHLKRIKSSVGNLTSILNDFLSLDKLEQGKVEVKPTHFEIDKFAEELIEEIQPTLKKGQKIIYTHTGKADVYIDRQMLKNILYNLISNASKYSEEDFVIEFTTSFDKTGLTLSVTDYGMGIPDSDQVHLFERFFRGKNVTNIQGTGLGLNIVKRYSDLINGEVTFNSKEGKGTTFNLTINNAHLTEPELLPAN
jgi:PAS domain S-box-containing protein